MKYCIITLLILASAVTNAYTQCICLGFNVDYRCHINLTQENSTAEHFWQCNNFCKKTNCKGLKNLN